MITSKSTPTIITLATNAIPLAGVLLYHWSLFNIFFFYWLENVVIALFNLVSMATAARNLSPAVSPASTAIPGNLRTITVLSLVGFFALHSGMFLFVHLIFIFVLFGPSTITAPTLSISLLSLLASHTVSFKQEQHRVKTQFSVPFHNFFRPYVRIVILHLALLFGGIIVKTLGTPIVALLLLTILKTGVDLIPSQRVREALIRQPNLTQKA